MAFFKTPGMARLYSGVTNSTPCDFCNFSRKASQSAGGFASRSWLKKEMPCSVVTSSLSEGGASLARALAILSEKLSLRRLPTMVTMWCVAIECPSIESGNVSADINRIARNMQVHASSDFGNAAFAEVGPSKTGRRFGGPPFGHKPQGAADHPPLFGLMRNFSPVARLA